MVDFTSNYKIIIIWDTLKGAKQQKMEVSYTPIEFSTEVVAICGRDR